MPYHIHKDKALQQYDAAFHLLNVTFPLVKDPKLLLGIVHNLSQSMEAAMDAILAYERELKLIPHYHNNFQSKFNLFRYKSMKRNKTPPSHSTFMMDLRELLELHERSPMAFQRGDRFVICGKDYRMKIISTRELQKYLAQTKDFLDHMGQIIRLG